MAQTAELSTETVFFGGKARLVSCIRCVDERGTLMPFEFGEMPFEPRRSFIIKDTTAGTIRGGHGHQTATQMLICLQGRIEIVIQHGDERSRWRWSLARML